MQELIYGIAQDAANHGFGVFGTDNPADRTIFWGSAPEAWAEGLLLIDISSPPPEQYIDTEYLIIDFWAKSPHSDRAKELLREIYNTYHRRYDWDVPDWHIYWSKALGSIVDADRSPEGSKFLRLSIQFMCRNLNNIS